MAVGQAERRKGREAQVQAIFGAESPAALDLLELTELGWHDIYDEISPSEEVVDDMLVVSGGTLDGLIRAARLALTDWRDLRVSADEIRGRS